MTVVRELFVKLGIDFDKNSVKQADAATSSLFGNMSQGLAAVTGIISVGAITTFLKEVVVSASDAAETTNLLSVSFKKNQGDVESWASTFAEEVGRSKYEMEKMAGTLGSVLTPLMDDNTNASAEMSKKFAGLAVDLGSFYNVADSDALAALRSGITGEAEPLKKFGVIMNQDALDAFALAKGIKKSVKDMTIAEKTALRYNFILEATSLAANDAKNTQGGFANMTKRAGAMLKDLATDAGKVVLPFFTSLLSSVAGILGKLKKFTQNTNLVKGALVGLGAGLIAIGVITAIAFAPALLALGKIMLAVTAVTLVSTDLFNLFSGKQSVIGTLIESLAGPGSAAEAVTFLKDSFLVLKDVFSQYILPYLKFVLAYWKGFFTITFKIIAFALKPMIFYTKVMFRLFAAIGSQIWKHLGPAFQKFGSWVQTVASNIKKYLMPVLEKVGWFIDKIVGGIGAAGEWVLNDLSGGGGKPPTIPNPRPSGGGNTPPPVINQTNNVSVSGGADNFSPDKLVKQVGASAGQGTTTALNALTHKAP